MTPKRVGSQPSPPSMQSAATKIRRKTTEMLRIEPVAIESTRSLSCGIGVTRRALIHAAGACRIGSSGVHALENAKRRK